MKACHRWLVLVLTLSLALSLAACSPGSMVGRWGGPEGRIRYGSELKTLDQLNPEPQDGGYLQELLLPMNANYLREEPFKDHAELFTLGRYTLRGNYFCTDDGRYLNADPLPSSFSYQLVINDTFSIKPNYYIFAEYSTIPARAAELILYRNEDESVFRSLDRACLMKDRTFVQNDGFSYLYPSGEAEYFVTESIYAGDSITGDEVSVVDLDDKMTMVTFTIRTHKDGNKLFLMITDVGGEKKTEYLCSVPGRREYDRYAHISKRFQTEEETHAFIDQWLKDKGITRGCFTFQGEAPEKDRIIPLFVQRVDTEREFYSAWLRLGPGTTCPALGTMIFGAQ